MSQQKRTKQINLSQMRKAFALKPLAIGVAGILLTGCGEEKQQADIYTNVDECINDHPDAADVCRTAYQNALDEASRTGPKYSTQNDCEYEFGNNQCQYVQTQSGSFFMPFMAGYMVSSLLSPRPYYQPIYTSYSPYSSYRSRWVTADGHIFDGDVRKRNYSVPKSVYKPKPTVSRTIKRGGFGSSVRAKSSWGSSSSRSSGWGG